MAGITHRGPYLTCSPTYESLLDYNSQIASINASTPPMVPAPNMAS